MKLLNSPKGQLSRKLDSYLKNDARLRRVVKATKGDFAKSGLTAHNWEHIYRDILNAIVIGEAEQADMEIVLPAIIMHDIGFLYGATGKTHGTVGAKKLPSFLKKHRIIFPREAVGRMAECIRTHKGSMHNERPETLEAKVVADADLLEKFGPFGVYQYVRTYTEFDHALETIISRKDRISSLRLETRTGKRIAEKGRKFVARFFDDLAEAYEPYKE